MDMDEDDDFYAPDEDEKPSEIKADVKGSTPVGKAEEAEAELEEGEERDDEDEDDDSDIDIITERKDGTKAAPPSTARYNEIRNIGQRTASTDAVVKTASVKKETASKTSGPISGAELPAVATSTIDVNAKPVYEPAGKPITQVNIDEDLPEHDKPWRRPGTDISDYFNYGFDEFTWALYASKQESLRSEFDPDKVAQNNKKMLEDMNMMMMGGMPGMPGMPGAAAPAAAMGMPGMDGMPPEMQAMMQQMMASGMDPSQMDPSAMFAGMAGAGAGGAGGQAGFSGQQGFGQAQNQQQGYGGGAGGYEQGGNRGNFRGRGRGRW